MPTAMNYKFLRGGSAFTRGKVEKAFRSKGPDAANYLSNCFGFGNTSEGSLWWSAVYEWLYSGNNREITDCQMVNQNNESPAVVLAKMVILAESMVEHYPNDVILPPNSGRRKRIMPTISESRQLWPDDSIVQERPREHRAKPATISAMVAQAYAMHIGSPPPPPVTWASLHGGAATITVLDDPEPSEEPDPDDF